MAQDIRVEAFDPEQIPDWDRRVVEFPRATAFHSAPWSTVLARTYGFRPRYLVATRGGNWEGVWPWMAVPDWRGRYRGIALPFTDHCGPLFREGESSSWNPDPSQWFKEGLAEPRESASAQLLGAIREEARARGWRSLELRTPPSSAGRPLVSDRMSLAFAFHEVPLAANDDEQLRQCSPSMRRCLRQSLAAGMPVAIRQDLESLRAYYRLHCATRRRQGAPPQPWRFFAELQEHLIGANLGFVVLVGRDPVAGAVFLRLGKHAIYKFGASDGRALSLRPNQRALWEGFRHAAALGCTTMDLGRTSLANEGLRRFKAGWGATEQRLEYVRYDLINHCVVVGHDHTLGLQARFFRLCPGWMARIISRGIYRYAA